MIIPMCMLMSPLWPRLAPVLSCPINCLAANRQQWGFWQSASSKPHCARLWLYLWHPIPNPTPISVRSTPMSKMHQWVHHEIVKITEISSVPLCFLNVDIQWLPWNASTTELYSWAIWYLIMWASHFLLSVIFELLIYIRMVPLMFYK